MSLKSNLKQYNLKQEHLQKIETFIKENDVEVISDLNELAIYINELFKDDVADIRAVFVAFNLIFTSPYYEHRLKKQ
ncbi:MAG: hypothetical protein ACOX3B_01660 [Bacilli bacterium]